jgi:hypothetical protein
MKNENFETINDAYQLSEGSIVKGKEQDELFQLGEYDAEKRAYSAYPFEDGVRFGDFDVLISEDELMDNYLVETKKDDEEAGDDSLLSDSI